MKLPLYAYLGRLAQLAPISPDSSTNCGIEPRLPLPMVNMISGGLHANRNMDFQDYMVIPVGAKSFGEGLEWLARLHRRLGDVLRDAGYEGYLTGDEGGYGPRVKSNREGAELLIRAIESSGLRPGKDVTLALDVAASHFFDATLYQLRCGSKSQLGSSEMIDLLESLAHDFPLVSIEDPDYARSWLG